MKTSFIRNKKILFAIITVILSLINTISYYHLWGTDINVPLTGFRSDSIGVLLDLNNHVRGGNAHLNATYGAPDLWSWSECFGDAEFIIPLLVILSRFVGSITAAVNICAVFNSVMIAASMYYVCTKLNISEAVSAVVAIIYSSLPFWVFAANTLWVLYGVAFYIPLFCYLAIRLMSEEPLVKKDLIMLIFVTFYVGLSVAYWAFFCMLILALVGIYALLGLKEKSKIMQVLMSYILIFLGILGYILPNIFHKINSEYFDGLYNNGAYIIIYIVMVSTALLLVFLFYKYIYPRITMSHIYACVALFCIFICIGYVVLKKYTDYIGMYGGRTVEMVELYSNYNIFGIFCPAPNNILFNLGESEVQVWDNLYFDSYTDMLGTAAGVGFIYSFMHIVCYSDNMDNKTQILSICGKISCFIMLFALKGGLASVVAVFVTTGIRYYTRLCVFIACFSLIAFGILADKVIGKINCIEAADIMSKVKYSCIFAGLLICVVLSMPADFIYEDSHGIKDYEARKAEYDEWVDYIARIESTFEYEEGSMVLELPYSIDDDRYIDLFLDGRIYELTIPAILAETTTWSYGGGWKTDTDIINNTEKFLKEVIDSGFSGIYVDSLLAPCEEELEKLEEYLGKPIVCNSSRRYFFNLKEYSEKIKGGIL